MKPPLIFRWDIDKTYLVSRFESLRGLLRIPFERATDKVSVPGVRPLIHALRRRAMDQSLVPRVYFLSASPPQIGAAIRAKLELDGIAYDGITFKDQVRNLIRGRFDGLREQIGYKLEELLRAAARYEPGSRELLFGDDWESDPFIYSLYADVLAGRIHLPLMAEILELAEVGRGHRAKILDLVSVPRPSCRVEGVFILRQRRSPPSALEVFGARLNWFDNYFECALRLYALGYLDVRGVCEVASEMDLSPSSLAASFEAAVASCRVRREWLAPVQRALTSRHLMEPVALAKLPGRARAWLRRVRSLAPASHPQAEPTPDYRPLAAAWSHRLRKEIRDEVKEADDRVDDGGR